jgi:integral membrane protein (TIGR01906 family)
MKHKKNDNKKSRNFNKLIILTFSITLFIIIIFGSLNYMIFNKAFYYKEYEKNNVYDALPENTDTEAITTNIIKYFRGNTELQYFTEDERSHMRDVKNLIRTMQLIYYGAAIITIALFYYCYHKFREDKHEFIRVLTKSLLYSSISSIIFLVLIFLMAVYSFDFLFMIFHLIFFPQGNWTFSPDSLLITIFPKEFFFDISLRIFVYAMFQAMVFFGIGYWMRKQIQIFEKYHH